MTIKELIEKLNLCLDLDKEVFVSIYENNDSGEQDHFKITDVVEYPDGHVQKKT